MEITEQPIVCSLCTLSFKTLRGLKVHQSKKHKPKNSTVVATAVDAPPSLLPTGIPSSLEAVLSLFLMKNMENTETQKKEKEEERLQRQKEKEEERLQRQKEKEEERLQRQKEKEEERLQRQKEKEERDLEFEKRRKMMMDIEDRKDQRWKEYVDMQNRTFDEWTENKKLEREDRQRFLEQQRTFMQDANNKNRRLSMGEQCHHQQDEMMIYGTSSRPLVRGQDLKHYMQHIVFDSPPPGMGEMVMEMCGLVDSMSTMEVCEFIGIKFDEHRPTSTTQPYVEILAWEDVVQEVERVMELPKDMVSTYIGHVSKTMPYSQPEKDWWTRRLSVKESFAPIASKPKEGYKRELPALEEEKENPPDILELVDQDMETYSLGPSKDVSAGDVVGSGDDSVSSTMRHYQRRQKLLETLQGILEQDVGNHRRRHWLQKRWSIMTGRMFLIMERIFQHGIYIPDSLMRYLQDTKFKTENTHVEPASRSLFKRRFLGERNLVQCQMCFCKLQGDGFDWERSHIVPSKKSTLGSNGEHNMVVCCSSCNTKTGDMDPFLHPEYRFDKSRIWLDPKKA